MFVRNDANIKSGIFLETQAELLKVPIRFQTLISSDSSLCSLDFRGVYYSCQFSNSFSINFLTQISMQHDCKVLISYFPGRDADNYLM